MRHTLRIASLTLLAIAIPVVVASATYAIGVRSLAPSTGLVVSVSTHPDHPTPEPSRSSPEGHRGKSGGSTSGHHGGTGSGGGGDTSGSGSGSSPSQSGGTTSGSDDGSGGGSGSDDSGSSGGGGGDD